MDFITIRDTITGKELTVVAIAQWGIKNSTIIETGHDPVEIGTRSVGKVIRGWMKERKKEVG